MSNERCFPASVLAHALEPRPDRQMVRRARGERALVDAGVDRMQVGRGEDAVEPRDRAAAVKAVAGVDGAVMLAEIVQAAAAIAPFIAIAHQDRRQRLALGDLVEDRARLLPPPEPLLRILEAVEASDAPFDVLLPFYPEPLVALLEPSRRRIVLVEHRPDGVQVRIEAPTP